MPRWASPEPISTGYPVAEAGDSVSSIPSMLPGHGPQWSWSMPKQPRGFGSLNRFVVVNGETNIAVEGDLYREDVARACASLNQHERRYGRAAVYDVRPIPPKLHDWGPEKWQALLNEGEEIRQARFDAIPKLLQARHYGAFEVLLARYLAKAGNAASIDWPAFHREFLEQSIVVRHDVRDPPQARAQLLHFSPGAVTHAEQDIVCALMDQLVREHYSRVNCDANRHLPAVQAERPRA